MKQKIDERGERLNAATGNWASPIPLDMAAELPPFPVEALPPIGQEMVKMVSEVNQVDMGLAGTIYLSILSTCMAKKADVDLGTHTEPLNLFTCSILPSGERKSSTLDHFAEPVYAYQNRVDEIGLVAVDEVTPVKLGSIMAKNSERIAILSTEGGTFNRIAGQDSKKIDLFLKAHAGDAWSYYRMNSPADKMTSPALTMCLTVQPEVIKMVGRQQHLRELGLLARFLYCHGEPLAGYRERTKKKINKELKAVYGEHISKLLDAPITDRSLALSAQAQQVWDEFYNSVETELREGERLYLLKDWGSKLAGAVARISGLLHIGTYGPDCEDVIGAGIVYDAVALGRYYMEHAIATFDIMSDEPSIESARKILAIIKRKNLWEFNGREMMRHTCFKMMSKVNAGLNVLIERCYIEADSSKETGKGGRPKGGLYLVNPQVHADRTDKTLKVA